MAAFWTFFFESAVEGSGLEKVFETVYGKNTVTHIFSWKTIFRTLCCYFHVEIAFQKTSNIYCQKKYLVLMKRLLKRLQIKILQMRNFKLMLLTHPFLLLFTFLESFLTYLMTSSVRTKDNGPNLPILETSNPLLLLVKIWGQLDVRCALRVRLCLWGNKNLFICGDRPPLFHSIIQQSFYEASRNSMLADILKLNQLHHKGKKENLKDAHMEIGKKTNYWKK